jgi:mycofactocin precursor
MSKATDRQEGTVSDNSDDEQPAIEEDIVKEELRIDGICGVY